MARRWPQGGTSATDVGTFESSPGGKGANEAVAVAKLGIHVSLVGRVGEDELGTGVRENFSKVNERAWCSALDNGVDRQTAEPRAVSWLRRSYLSETGRLNVAGVFTDPAQTTGVAIQLVYSSSYDADADSSTKVTVVCAGANGALHEDGEESRYARDLLTRRPNEVGQNNLPQRFERGDLR
eukprot:5661244-Prymnesium_polylepis.2